MEVIKLTDEEIKEAKDYIDNLYATIEKSKYIHLSGMTIQEVMSHADTIIKKYPHLSYNNIYIDVKDNEYPECYLSYYIPRGNMDYVLQQHLQDKLNTKIVEYNNYLQLKKKFEEE